MVRLIKEGKPIQVAIAMAAKELGLQSLSLTRVAQAVSTRPNDFPPAYRRLR
jgi:Flp pilus assembly protein TadB